MSRVKKEDNVPLDRDCQDFIHSMVKGKVITKQGVPIMESALPLLKYKYKHETKKSIEEWYAEIIMLFIGVFLTTIVTDYKSIYLFILITLFVFRMILFIKTGR